MNLQNIFIAGSGNIAWHIAHAFSKANICISGLWSNNNATLKELSNSLNIPILTENEFFNKTGLFFLCVNDSSIDSLAAKCSTNNTLIHCSGSVHISNLTKYSENSGVFYPVQTLKKGIKTNFSKIPILIEYSNENVKQLLTEIAKKLKCKYYYYSSEQRIIIHISAVFANNFSNFMFTLAQEFLKNNKINPNILNDLIKETALKAINYGAFYSQTGPSVRGDKITIEKHLNELNNLPDLKNFYIFVTD